jgi:hypothetical protein
MAGGASIHRHAKRYWETEARSVDSASPELKKKNIAPG